jgi:hypothetical protein
MASEALLCSTAHIKLHNSSEGSENMDVTLYQKMYAIVVSAADRAIDLLSKPETAPQAKALLEQALLSAEDVYLCSADE